MESILSEAASGREMGGGSSRPYALLFGGQAGAAGGLGRRLASWPGFGAWLDKVSAQSAKDAKWLMLEAPEHVASGRFQAARLMVLYNQACAEMALSELGPPVALCGYSLGFYAAACAAGCAPLSVFLEWVERVNSANAIYCPAGSFALAVTVGLDRAALEGRFGDWGLSGLALTGINNATQLVFAGPAREVDEALAKLKGVSLGAQRLGMDVPLHCRHVEPAAQAVKDWWAGVPLSPPRLPLISPVNGEIVESGEAFRSVMLESLVSPTNWAAVARRLALIAPELVMDASAGGDIGRMTRWNWRGARVKPLIGP